MKSLSIIIPAYNEANNLRAAYASALRALKLTGITDYEIIIVTNDRPDGSNDGTPAIAMQIQNDNPHTILLHNPYVGLGYKFRQGARAANKLFVTWIPGDNETVEESIVRIFSHVDKADVILTYTGNKEVRSWKRRCVSWGFTTLCNFLFGLQVKYFTGICIFRRELILQAPLTCNNFAYMAEIIIYLLKSGVPYIEIPQLIKPTSGSSAFRFKSVIECIGTLIALFVKIHFLRKRVVLSDTPLASL